MDLLEKCFSLIVVLLLAVGMTFLVWGLAVSVWRDLL